MNAIDIPIYDAKNRLSALLAAVQKGAEFTITNRGQPVARLVPVTPVRDPAAVAAAVARIREMRKGLSLGGLKIKDLINEGRKV